MTTACVADRKKRQNFVIQKLMLGSGIFSNVDFERGGIVVPSKIGWMPSSIYAVLPYELNYIYLTGENITDDHLKVAIQLPGLKGLNISNSTITDAGLQQLAEKTRLMELQLFSINTITNDAITKFRQLHPKCNLMR
jgi:hypothetical protein